MNRLSAAGVLSAFITNPIKIHKGFHPFFNHIAPNGLLDYLKSVEASFMMMNQV